MSKKATIGFVDGELKAVGTVGGRQDVCESLADQMTSAVGARRSVWVGIMHGGNVMDASVLLAELRRRLDVEYVYTRPLSASIYLYAGKDALGCVAMPVDELPLRLPVPPELA
jgi:fatty acid-binding protein DegV